MRGSSLWQYPNGVGCRKSVRDSERPIKRGKGARANHRSRKGFYRFNTRSDHPNMRQIKRSGRILEEGGAQSARLDQDHGRLTNDRNDKPGKAGATADIEPSTIGGCKFSQLQRIEDVSRPDGADRRSADEILVLRFSDNQRANRFELIQCST